MKRHFAGIAIAALLLIGPTFPGHAEDAASSTVPSSNRGAAAERAASVAGAESRRAGVTAGGRGDNPTTAPALRASLSPAIRLLSHRLLGTVSDLLAASLPQPDSLEPDPLDVPLLKTSVALAVDGPAIVDAVVAADAMPDMPHVDFEQVGNFAITKIKEAVLAVTGG
jgi:hypothetical protein